MTWTLFGALSRGASEKTSNTVVRTGMAQQQGTANIVNTPASLQSMKRGPPKHPPQFDSEEFMFLDVSRPPL